jgi:hypothetical protein
MTDVASGREIELTNLQIRFKGPQIISQETAGKTVVAEMSFNSTKEAEEWVLEQKAKGFDVQLAEEGEKTRYRVGTAHAQIRLGGDKEGLRAIGYIAQTFLAHSFPDIGRAPDLQGIKDYTLKNVGSGFVWWDFDPPDDLPTNKFPFGHRVIVGVNKDDGTAYARISFFSTLNFAVRFGPVPFEASRSVITDIDPLAKALPNDILSWTEDAAKGAVSKPNDLSASLAEAISPGKVLDLFTRKIVGWSMRDHLRAELAIAALSMAIQRQRPAPGLIHHSDRGSQYAAADYCKALNEAGLVQSMSRKGNCWDCESVGALGGPDPCCD